MNKVEFEEAVKELRYRQRRFFNCKKDDPDRQKALEMMREQEIILRNEIDFVLAVRPRNKTVESDREQFFLDVAEMMRKQREWAKQGGGSWYMNPAREAEKKVDAMLTKWNEEREAERRRKMEEEAKRQMKLFD